MNLTPSSRSLVAALAPGGAFLGFAGPAQAASAGAAPRTEDGEPAYGSTRRPRGLPHP
ncbi:hypothetical protein ACFZCG_36740 [Streptomyces tanashiensis]|uniref:hypothetical protein n=1 Tax=Streptomyces tanashiensis TaxID=67367 RepID=UPI0036EF43C5